MFLFIFVWEKMWNDVGGVHTSFKFIEDVLCVRGVCSSALEMCAGEVRSLFFQVFVYFCVLCNTLLSKKQKKNNAKQK